MFSVHINKILVLLYCFINLLPKLIVWTQMLVYHFYLFNTFLTLYLLKIPSPDGVISLTMVVLSVIHEIL